MSDALPPGGFTEADLTAVRAAIVRAATNPVQQVRFSDGRQLTYRTVDELLAVERLIVSSLRAARPATIMGMARLSSFRRH